MKRFTTKTKFGFTFLILLLIGIFAAVGACSLDGSSIGLSGGEDSPPIVIANSDPATELETGLLKIYTDLETIEAVSEKCTESIEIIADTSTIVNTGAGEEGAIIIQTTPLGQLQMLSELNNKYTGTTGPDSRIYQSCKWITVTTNSWPFFEVYYICVDVCEPGDSCYYYP